MKRPLRTRVTNLKRSLRTQIAPSPWSPARPRRCRRARKRGSAVAGAGGIAATLSIPSLLLLTHWQRLRATVSSLTLRDRGVSYQQLDSRGPAAGAGRHRWRGHPTGIRPVRRRMRPFIALRRRRLHVAAGLVGYHRAEAWRC